MPLSCAFRCIGAVLALAVVAACSDSPRADPGIDASGPMFGGHVHDLGVNPADGRVQVATHDGLYVIDGERADKAGDAHSDLMGFAVVGPDTFIASGHRAINEPGPANMGLIRTTDAGQSWSVVSLDGVSDFHALTAVGQGQRIYGLDSATGAVKRSGDGGRNWQEAAAIEARDLDADPAAPDRVVATTPNGLMVSTDAAESFRPATAQPPRPLVFVDHLPDAKDAGSVAGLDGSGQLWRRDGNGWRSGGPGIGPPQAFSAVSENSYLAVVGVEVFRTDDGGDSWHQIGPTTARR